MARTPAKVAGGVWLAAGILYGAWKTRGFGGSVISFEVPPEKLEDDDGIGSETAEEEQ